MKKTALFLCIISLVHLPLFGFSDKINLTLDSAVEIMMNNSYRIRSLRMSIQERRYWLAAEQAGLKSSASLSLTAPDLNNTSDYKWDSLLERNVIYRENTDRWQMDFTINQPIILFGFPTNGNLSLNYRVWRYGQRDGSSYTNYYNRLYLRLVQPLFLPNAKKNAIEGAELDLEKQELNYLDDQVKVIQDVSEDYYDLFRLAYRNTIFSENIKDLQNIETVILAKQPEDSLDGIELKQIRLEIANAQEELLANKSSLRIRKVYIKQKLRLDDNVELEIPTPISIPTLKVDEETALNYGFDLRPSMRNFAIDKRKSEIRMEQVKSWNAFRVNLEVTYGLEREDDYIQHIWRDYDNSNSITVNAYIPIWDWGRHKAQIQATQISLQRQDLQIEQSKLSIGNQIKNAIINVNEYQTRTKNQQKSVLMAADITAQSIDQYDKGRITLQDLLQTVQRKKETRDSFLELYLDYREAILSLMVNTYYDFESDKSLLKLLEEKYGDS